MNEYWSLVTSTNEAYVWVEQYSTEIVVISKPDGYDWYTIYDSTDRAVEGHSLGPFQELESAIKRVQQDIPKIELVKNQR